MTAIQQLSPAAAGMDRIDALLVEKAAKKRSRRRVTRLLVRGLVYLGAALTAAVLLFLVVYILVQGVPHLKASLFEWEYNSDNVSLMPALVNTVLMALLALVMAVPFGVGSAIYLVEYAKRGSKFVSIVRITTETLQGIPSIIYGLFGMLFFVTALHWGLSMLAGACTLAIMVLPVVMRTTEEALLAVPDSYRQGSYGLGAGRLRTVFRCVLPSAVPGILGGVILALGRCVGEVAALLYHRRLRRLDPQLRRGGPGRLPRLDAHAGRAHVRALERGPARQRDVRHGRGAARARGADEHGDHAGRQEDEQGSAA